ncbi:MAG: hypothetical protein ABSH12_07465 [Endomicrobiales bacterium]
MLHGVVTGDVKFHLAYVLRFLAAPDTLHFYGSVKMLYHNPPLWILVESLTYLVAVKSALPFAVLIKLWPVLADVGIMVILWNWLGRDSGKGLRAAWIYALNPVSILVTGFHGQFDPVVIFFVMASLFSFSRGSENAVDDNHHEARKTQHDNCRMLAYILLGFAIALKDYPVLLLPFFFVLALKRREQWKALMLMVAPALFISLPFVLADPRNFLEALFLYSGSTDFGMGGVIRLVSRSVAGAGYDASAELPRQFLAIMKLVYILLWGWLVVRFYRKTDNILFYTVAVFLGFLVIYPGVSAQYLFWIIPFLLLIEDTPLWRYSLLSALAMMLFYCAYFPRILFGRLPLDNLANWLPQLSLWMYLLVNAALWIQNIAFLLMLKRYKFVRI